MGSVMERLGGGDRGEVSSIRQVQLTGTQAPAGRSAPARPAPGTA